MRSAPDVLNPQTQRVVADVAAGASMSGAGFAWLHTANEILTLVATMIAIGSALFAIRYHITARRKLLDQEAAEATSEDVSLD